MKNSILQLNIEEIHQVVGGHDEGTHMHICGLHIHEIVALAGAGIFLFTVQPYLAMGAVIVSAIGFIAYKYFYNTDSDQKNRPAYNKEGDTY